MEGALGRDIRDGALALDEMTDAIGILSPVGMDNAVLGQVGQQVLGRPAVHSLAWRQVKGRAAVLVSYDVDVGVTAASTAAVAFA